ncbi:P antigen family member 1 [Camelus dromedarius]|uniref:P antigen family member 1 n=1 Tax=Camelus dromedarius TaxID=9838 RepID=UPI0031195C39
MAIEVAVGTGGQWEADVGSIFRRVKSTYRPRKRSYDQACVNPVGPVVAHSDKQPQEWEPPTTSQDIRPGEEKKDEGASAVEVGNIFRRVKSTYRLRKRSYDQACVNPVEPVVAHSDKQPQEWEPPTTSQDIRPGEEKKDEGASAVEGPVPEADQWEVAEPETGREHDPGVNGKRLPKAEPF